MIKRNLFLVILTSLVLVGLGVYLYIQLPKSEAAYYHANNTFINGHVYYKYDPTPLDGKPAYANYVNVSASELESEMVTTAFDFHSSTIPETAYFKMGQYLPLGTGVWQYRISASRTTGNCHFMAPGPDDPDVIIDVTPGTTKTVRLYGVNICPDNRENQVYNPKDSLSSLKSIKSIFSDI